MGLHFKGVWQKFEQVDVSTCLSELLYVKDSDEIKSVEIAAKATTGIMTKFLHEEISLIIDEDRTVKHSTLSESVEGKIDDDNFFKRRSRWATT